ncbi:MAG: hypothetical protein IJ559_07170 [Prevotella sp.]|nr:hypothetical protein [Prevotella sp.]
MKKQYMTPATEWVMIDKVTILAGSGPGATDQGDPTVGSREGELDLWSADDPLFNLIP